MDDNIEPLAYSRQQAARAIGVSKPTLDELIKQGAIRARRVGKRVLIERESLVEFLRGEA